MILSLPWSKIIGHCLKARPRCDLRSYLALWCLGKNLAGDASCSHKSSIPDTSRRLERILFLGIRRKCLHWVHCYCFGFLSHSYLWLPPAAKQDHIHTDSANPVAWTSPASGSWPSTLQEQQLGWRPGPVLYGHPHTLPGKPAAGTSISGIHLPCNKEAYVRQYWGLDCQSRESLSIHFGAGHLLILSLFLQNFR